MTDWGILTAFNLLKNGFVQNHWFVTRDNSHAKYFHKTLMSYTERLSWLNIDLDLIFFIILWQIPGTDFSNIDSREMQL